MALERQKGRGAKNFFAEEDEQDLHHIQSGLKQEDESQVWEANFKAAEAAEGREGPE